MNEKNWQQRNATYRNWWAREVPNVALYTAVGKLLFQSCSHIIFIHCRLSTQWLGLPQWIMINMCCAWTCTSCSALTVSLILMFAPCHSVTWGVSLADQTQLHHEQLLHGCDPARWYHFCPPSYRGKTVASQYSRELEKDDKMTQVRLFEVSEWVSFSPAAMCKGVAPSLVFSTMPLEPIFFTNHCKKWSNITIVFVLCLRESVCVSARVCV